MTRFTLLLVAVTACSHHAPAAGPASSGTPAPAAATAPASAAAIDAAHAEAIVNASDRDERDRKRDAQRKPAQLLLFMRNPADTRDWNADPDAKDPRVHTQDLFALKFVKP